MNYTMAGEACRSNEKRDEEKGKENIQDLARTWHQHELFVMIRVRQFKIFKRSRVVHAAYPSAFSHRPTSRGLRPDSFAQARLEWRLSWRSFNARIRDARKVRREQRSGDRTSDSGVASSPSWEDSSDVVSFTSATGAIAIFGSFRRMASV